ncbi:hypothetical protein [Streptomyces malaysiensis]|nr:hypothetical protein [Streptomyces samsunensis]
MAVPTRAKRETTTGSRTCTGTISALCLSSTLTYRYLAYGG